MIVCLAVTQDGFVDSRWGRAERVAVADVSGNAIESWHEFDVGWGSLHDSGTEGGHHARVARFLREHEVGAVVANHMGPDMEHMLGKMGSRFAWEQPVARGKRPWEVLDGERCPERGEGA